MGNDHYKYRLLYLSSQYPASLIRITATYIYGYPCILAPELTTTKVKSEPMDILINKCKFRRTPIIKEWFIALVIDTLYNLYVTYNTLLRNAYRIS